MAQFSRSAVRFHSGLAWRADMYYNRLTSRVQLFRHTLHFAALAHSCAHANTVFPCACSFSFGSNSFRFDFNSVKSLWKMNKPIVQPLWRSTLVRDSSVTWFGHCFYLFSLHRCSITSDFDRKFPRAHIHFESKFKMLWLLFMFTDSHFN